MASSKAGTAAVQKQVVQNQLDLKAAVANNQAAGMPVAVSNLDAPSLPASIDSFMKNQNGAQFGT